MKYIFLIIKYTVLGKCWLGHFSVQFSECTSKSRVSRRRTSVLGGTRNCTEKWPSQQVPRKGIFYDQNYIFSHVDRVFFGSIWTNSNIRSLKVPTYYCLNLIWHKLSWWLRMLRRRSGNQEIVGSIPTPASCFFMLHTKCKFTSNMLNFLPYFNKLPWSNGYNSWSGNPWVQGSIPAYAFLYDIYLLKINFKYVHLQLYFNKEPWLSD